MKNGLLHDKLQDMGTSEKNPDPRLSLENEISKILQAKTDPTGIECRKLLGQPQTEQVTIAMRNTYLNIRKNFLGPTGERGIKSFLLQGKKILEAEKGPVSRPFLSAQLLQKFASNQRDEAVISLTEKRFSRFMFYFDFALSISIVSNMLLLAEDEIRGDKNKSIGLMLDDPDNSHLSQVEKADLHILLNYQIQNASDLLKQDNSGFKLVDILAQRLKEGILTEDYHCPKYISAGAEFGRDSYKHVYNMSSFLYSPKSAS